MYEPRPVDTSAVELPAQLLELMEQIAENVHENWSAGRIAAGWTYGEVRDDLSKTTPCLVPYAQLSEEEKDFDRNTALQTLKLIMALGYTIEKRETKMNELQHYVDSFQAQYDAFRTGCDALEEQGVWSTELRGEMDAFYTNELVSVIIRLIAADGTITCREVEYLNKTFGFDYSLEALIAVYENCKEEIDRAFDEQFENGITHMRTINQKLADTYKELLRLVCRILIASDGVVAASEVAEAERLMAMCR